MQARTTDTRRIAMAVDRVVATLGLAQVAELTGIPRRTIQNHAAGICAPSVPALLAYVRACDEADRRELAAEMLDSVLGLAGREARPVAVVCPETPPALAALHVSAEVGDVVRWAEEALRDGVIDYTEAAQGEREIRQARHAVDELGAMVRGAGERTPQLALGGVR